MSGMQEKIAQRMSAWQSFKEWANLPRKLRESVSREIYGRHMDMLREVDRNVRQLATDKWPDLESSIKSAKQEFRNARYPAAMYYANRINQFIYTLWEMVKPLETEMDEELRKFYFEKGDLTPEQLAAMHGQLTGTVPAGYEQSEKVASDLMVQAGLFDYFSERQRALRLHQKMYRNVLLAQKTAAREIMTRSDRLFDAVKGTLKEMGNLRASGDIAGYLRSVKALKLKQETYSKRFSELYKKYFADIIGPMVGEKPAEKVEERLVDKPIEEPMTIPGPEPPKEAPIITVPQLLGQKPPSVEDVIEEAAPKVSPEEEQQKKAELIELLSKYSSECNGL